MLGLAINWILEFSGRLHPLMVHFPIGLIVGALILESISRYRKNYTDYTGLIYLGAFSAVFAAIMGQLLFQYGDYSGGLIDQHQWAGWVTAGLSLITACCYWKKSLLPVWLPYFSLCVTSLSIGFAGHFGASITHGEDYLTKVMTKNNRDYNITLDPAHLSAYDSLSLDQLDQLNVAVRAIFAHHCFQCHSTNKRKGGLALDHEKGVFAGGDYGPILVKGGAEESEIVRRLRLPRDDEEAMPKKGKLLTQKSIRLIELWINRGAHWAEEDSKVFREAPITLVKPDLPESDVWRHPVDQLVDKYFKENNIKWASPIDDRRFIRRAFMDITGLLPTPERVKKFIDENADDKRQRLVSELLSDKEHYSQHWLSFWNDLLRNDYSGTGFITGGRKQITHWLYESLANEKPFNQMVTELVNPSEESEGFIKGIQWRGEINSSQRTELQAAQNISQSLLGLNLKCASCHNSFVNNLTLDQAYGFANVFARQPLELYRCDKPTGRMANTSFIYPELGQVLADSLVDRLGELARIITQPENGRLYRTLVNRFWDRLFGRGIVAPVDEMDKLPWSQELLDWLAADFIDSGYNLQHLLEVLMTSKTYQLPAVNYDGPNYISSESFVFRGPLQRRLSAEQFADAVSQTINPLYYGVAYQPGNPPFPSQWIWYQDKTLDRNILPMPGKRYFRKRLQLEDAASIESVDILITADHSYELFINENKIGNGDDWRKVERYRLPGEDILKNNIIGIIGTNEGQIPNPAGLLFALKINYPDSVRQYFYSDSSWSATNKTPEKDWNSFNFNDQEWESVSVGDSKTHWGRMPEFTFDENEDKIHFVRASLVRLDPFMRTLGRPTRENVATSRDDTPTLLQAMMLTNSNFLFDNIREGSKKWLEYTNRDHLVLIDGLYQSALGRKPSKREHELIIKKFIENSDDLATIEDLIWSVILLPEFQFL